MDLRDCLKALRLRWLTITVLTLLGLGAGLGVTAVSQDQYEAHSQLFVAARSTSDAASLNQGSAFSQARVKSYAAVVTSPRVLSPVIKRLGLNTTPSRLAERVTAAAEPDTVLIDITVVDSDAARAAQVSDALAAEARRQIILLETPPGGDSFPVYIGITRTAAIPTAPVSPRPLLNAAAGLLAGLCAGVAFALLRHTLDTTLRTGDALAKVTGLPVLGWLPYDKDASADPVAVAPGTHNARAEAFRLIRANLQFAQVDRRPRVIVVTSPLPGEGKTTTAVNLALSLAETGQSICLVDADLRKPCVARTLGLIQDAGLTSVLIGDASAAEVMQQIGEKNLRVLTSGPVPPNPSEILASQRMRQVLEDLASSFDTVIVDSAPLLPVADTVGLAPAADGAILVVRAGRTPSDRARAAAGALSSVGVPALGAILNMVRQHESKGYGYGYGEAAAASPARLNPPRPRDTRRTDTVAAQATNPDAGT